MVGTAYHYKRDKPYLHAIINYLNQILRTNIRVCYNVKVFRITVK